MCMYIRTSPRSSGVSRISVRGVLEGEVPARGWVREGDVAPPARSAEAFEEILYMYLVYQ